LKIFNFGWKSIFGKKLIGKKNLFVIFFIYFLHCKHHPEFKSVSNSSLTKSELRALWKLGQRCQFHQYFTLGFFVRKFCAKLFWTWILGLNFFWRKNIRANAHIKCWWNLPQAFVVDQINRGIILPNLVIFKHWTFHDDEP
jgi:hypothetical protein